jgi:outer membrane protein TolC
MRRLIALSLLAAGLHAATIGELFDALRKHPATEMDAMQAKAAELAAQKVTDAFYPSASLYATFEHYNSPTNLRPMSPAESVRMAKEGRPYPFATTIERIGAKVQMPIYAKELFDLADKARAAAKSARLKKRLNFLRNEALLLGSDATWRYLEGLKTAMQARRRSIEKTLEDVRLKVASGRSPGIAVDKLEATLAALDTAINEIDIKMLNLRGTIESLTGVTLSSPVALSRKGSLKTEELFPLKPLRWQIEAKERALDATRSRLYPKVGFSAFWSENYGQSAVGFKEGLNDDVSRGYGNYMVAVTVPLFEKPLYTEIERAKVEVKKERFALAKSSRELSAKAEALRASLPLYERSEKLAQKSVESQKKLLDYAKVAFDTGRIIEEEYLRYEEKLLDAQSRALEARAKYWQALGELAVLYGNDLSEIVE